MKIAIISDVHEDIIMLQMALKQIERQNCDTIVCLGDIVGYAPAYYCFDHSRNGQKCVDIIQKECDIVVAGNHDLYEIRKIPQYTSGFTYPGDWYNLPRERRDLLSNHKIWLYEEEVPANINSSAKDFFDTLPEFFVLESDSCVMLFSHSVFPDLTGSTVWFPKFCDDFLPHRRFMDKQNAVLSFSGHKHVEGVWQVSDKTFDINDFGNYSLKSYGQSIITPCLVSTEKKNGYLIFDTESSELMVVPLF